MTPVFIAKLRLRLRFTNIGVQKINDSASEIYSMISTVFSLQDNSRRVWFFEKTFLLVNTSIELVLGMLFFSFSNTDIKFAELGKLT